MVRSPRVLIIGTGFAGVGAAIRLKRRGSTDITILERAGDIGGTWRDNTYPGAACDIPSHLYSLSFEPKADWSRRYAPQREIQSYLQRCVARHDLRRHIRFERNVVALRFDEPSATWTATTEDGERFDADVVVSAIGGLRDPVYPEIPGREDFAGAQMHTSRWDHSVDLHGARVGVIGTGASSVQVAPRLAEIADHLTVFQRTPAWIVPRGDRAYSTVEKAAFRWVPGARRGYRGLLYALLEGRYLFFAVHRVLNRIAQARALQHLHAQVDDPRTRRALRPDYRMGCKRVLVSDDFYPMFNRANVTLATSPIEGITRGGVRTAEGHVELDAIVWATGFAIDRVLHPIEVTGVGGAELHRRFDERPSAYLGITAPDFPNLFFLQGPNTGLGHNSIIYMLEAQIEYVLAAMEVLRDPQVAYLDVRREVHDAFVAELDDHHEGLVWSSGCDSWYLDEQGRNFTLWPDWTFRYRQRTSGIALDDYRVVTVDELPAARRHAYAS